MYILGFDPGVTTGWAAVFYPLAPAEAPELVTRGQIMGGSLGLANELFTDPDWESDLNRVEHVVFEGFRLRRGTAMTEDQIAPTYGIGVIQACCIARGIPMTMQMPGERKIATNEALERLFPGLDTSYKNRHSLDALRHVVTYLVGTGHRPTIEKGWPRGV